MLQIRDVGFSYGQDGFRLANVSLTAGAGTRMGIIGRSGSGKSTLIKLLGGHLIPSHGSIFLNSEEITRLEPGTRGVSTVFQDLALFPHLSVYKNVEFPLTVRRENKQDRRHAVEEYLTRFGIWERRDFKPQELSGGERQRTALARSLISNPSLLLLDEPTAALDSQQKAQLATFLDEMLQLESVPLVVIVTHDHEFAFSVCDHLAVMRDGQLIAQDETERLLASPHSVEAALILDTFSVIRGAVGLDGKFQSIDGALAFPVAEKYLSFKGKECAVLLRSDAVSLAPSSHSNFPTMEATVASVQVRGIYTRMRLETGEQVILCDWFKGSGGMKPTRGQIVTLSFSIDDAQVIPVRSPD